MAFTTVCCSVVVLFSVLLSIFLQFSLAAVILTPGSMSDLSNKRAAGPAAWDMHAWGKRNWGDLQAWGKRSAAPSFDADALGGVDGPANEAELASVLQALVSTRARRAKVGDWQNFNGWGRR